MEFLDIILEDGTVTGKKKERKLIHQDGDLHRTSHVWIARKSRKGRTEILLQKRSQNKDSHPGCYDISSAGHIPAGCGFVESALRELEEELGIRALEDELIYMGTRRFLWKEVFHGEMFVDNQISNVYLMWKDVDIEALQLQKEEIDSVRWMDFEECYDSVLHNRICHCIPIEELEMLCLRQIKDN